MGARLLGLQRAIATQPPDLLDFDFLRRLAYWRAQSAGGRKAENPMGTCFIAGLLEGSEVDTRRWTLRLNKRPWLMVVLPNSNLVDVTFLAGVPIDENIHFRLLDGALDPASVVLDISQAVAIDIVDQTVTVEPFERIGNLFWATTGAEFAFVPRMRPAPFPMKLAQTAQPETTIIDSGDLLVAVLHADNDGVEHLLCAAEDPGRHGLTYIAAPITTVDRAAVLRGDPLSEIFDKAGTIWELTMTGSALNTHWLAARMPAADCPYFPWRSRHAPPRPAGIHRT